MERSHVYGVELSRLRNLCSEPQPLRKIHFRLESDTLPARESYLDLYVPEFHQYGSSTDRPVRHLDITSTWRKLSTTHAEELKFWEDMFAAVLEYTISNHLIDLVDDMHDCNIDRYPGDLDGRICAFVNKLGGRTFPVNVREIASCMLELYRRHGCQHQWFASSGNFYNALCEFLRTRDCFLDAPLHPTIKVAFTASFSPQNEPAVVGILRRFGPVMGFTRLDAFTTEDAWCEIHPTYVEPALDPSYASFLRRPEYRLASDWVKFDWDSGVQGFRGYVRPMPSLGEAGVRTCLNVDLAVVSRRLFPDGVVFERNLRVRMKLSVCRITNFPSVSSPNDSIPTLQRCRGRRSLFNPPPGLQDLGEVMKANKRSAASSPTKPPGSRRKRGMKAELWGRNVPAWGILPDYKPEVEISRPVQVNRVQARPQTAGLGRSFSGVFEDTEHSLLQSSIWPQPVRTQLRLRRSESSLSLSYTAKLATKTSDDGYVVVQSDHSLSSSSDLDVSSAPLEMKQSPGRPNTKQSHYSRPAPATPVCPASAPHPSHRRTDSVLDTSSDQKRPVSTVWISTDDTTAATSHKSSGTVDNTAWVRWRNGDDEGLGGLSHMEEQWYMPPGDQTERVERLGRSIKEWYDAMLLKRDTPRKKTREEESQEQAFEEAFLGGDSGEDGDIEGDD